MSARSWPRIVAWGAALVAGVGALVVVVPRLLGMLAALVPLEAELALGQALVEAYVAPEVVCSRPEGDKALRRLAERLQATVATPYTFTVTVADMPEVNALAAPGGQIILLRGLLDEAESPDEVAGVLAHEMAHVVERHPTEGLLRVLGTTAIFHLLIGDSSALAAAISEIGATLVNLSYSRKDEAEADATAVAMLQAADIRIDGLVALFERLVEEEGEAGGLFAFLATHPASTARAEAARHLMGIGGRAMSEQDWAALAAICES